MMLEDSKSIEMNFNEFHDCRLFMTGKSYLTLTLVSSSLMILLNVVEKSYGLIIEWKKQQQYTIDVIIETKNTVKDDED